MRDEELGAHGAELGGVLGALRVVRVHRVSVGAAPLLDKCVPFEEFGREDIRWWCVIEDGSASTAGGEPQRGRFEVIDRVEQVDALQEGRVSFMGEAVEARADIVVDGARRGDGVGTIVSIFPASCAGFAALGFEYGDRLEILG